MKQCSKCKIEYKNEEDNFYKNKTNKDGHSYWCKKCVAKYHQKPSVKKARKKYRKEYLQRSSVRKAIRKCKQNYRQKNIVSIRKEQNCRQRTKVWLKKIGVDWTKQKCEECDKLAEIHHNNYDDYKDINFLCSRHHKQLHKLLREKNVHQQTKN